MKFGIRNSSGIYSLRECIWSDHRLTVSLLRLMCFTLVYSLKVITSCVLVQDSMAVVVGKSNFMARRKVTGDDARRGVSSTKTKKGDGNLPSPVIAFLLTIVFGIGGILAGLGVFWGPSPLDASASTELFSASRAQAHIVNIAKAPHPPGTDEHTRVRGYIIEQLRTLKFDVHEQQAIAKSKSKRGLTLANVVNIIGHRKGTAAKPGPPLVLMAHYDSVPTGPGAGDDAVGVAAILEALRALGAQRLINDVYVVITDAEELGLLGAKAWFASDEAKKLGKGVIINLEARGSSGPVFMFETGANNRLLIEHLSQSAPYPAASSLMYNLYKLLPNDTDMTVAKSSGWNFLNLAMVASWQSYHTARDTPANLSQTSLQQYGEYLLPLVQRLGNSPLGELVDNDAGDAVYFDIAGRALLVVPQSYVWPVVGVCAVLFVLAALLCLSDPLRLRGWLVSTIAVPAVATAMYFAVRSCIPFLLPTDSNVPWGMPYSGIWIAGSALLTVFSLGLVLFRWVSTTPVGRSSTLGPAFYWLALCFASAVYMPGAAYIAVIPLITLVLAVLLWRIPFLAGLFGSLVPAVWMSLVVGLFLLMGPKLLPELSIVAVLLAATLAPLARACRGMFEGLAGIGAAICIVTLIAIPRVLQEGEQTAGLAYWVDADTGKAAWLSTEATAAGFDGGKLEIRPTRQDGRKYVPDWGWQVFATNTEQIYQADIGDVVRKGDVWTLVVPNGCREVFLSNPGKLSVNVNGNDITDGDFCRIIVPTKNRIYLRKVGTSPMALQVHYVLDGLPKEAGVRMAGWLPAPVQFRDGIGIKTDVRIHTFGMLLN